VKWYEAGGIEEVREWGQRSGCRSKSGGGEVASEGRFRTIGEAVAWGRRELGVAVSYKKRYSWFRR
jgi:hypothetical protein